ncbi:MAG: hypothetical protein R2825_28710 [Saprospiraceae bacterium]
MTEDALYPITEAENLIHRFLQCELPKGEFSHEAHLLTALYLLAKHGENTLPIIRQHLKDYLKSIGVESTDTSGYHETLTVFWLWFLKKRFVDENGKIIWNQNNVDDLIEDFDLTERNIWLEHYSKECMMSVDARKNFVEPDIKPLD